MPEVSIVVPVYNVEKYLVRCVESLRKQSLKDIEIILVDDGSPDACPKMCDELATLDGRIKVIHKENGGLSSARNAGLRVARGKYIGFVDSDDDVSEDMYEKMLQIISEQHVDFVMSDYMRVLENGERYLNTLNILQGRYSREEIKEKIFPQLIMREDVDYGPLLSVWHCLYNLEFLKKYDIQFDEQVRWSEDNIFSTIVGYCASSFYYLKGEGLYHYYQNPGTITTSYRKGAWDVYKIMNQHLKEFFKDTLDYDFSNQLKLHLVYYACVCIGQAMMLQKAQCKEELRIILKDEMLRNAFKKIKFDKKNFKLDIQLYLMKFRCCRLLELMLRRR